MNLTFNPLAKKGFDLNVAGCILTPGNIFIPIIQILDDMQLKLITPENRNEYNYDGENSQITIISPGLYYITDLDIYNVVIDLQNDGEIVWVSSIVDGLYFENTTNEFHVNTHSYEISAWGRVTGDGSIIPGVATCIPLFRIGGENLLPDEPMN
jgi:hypothetical protein